MERYWVYIDTKIQGPLDIPALRKVAGFTLLTQVCKEGEQTWRVADEVIEIKAYFLSPPRISSLPVEIGNTALAQPEPLSLPKEADEPFVMTMEGSPTTPAPLKTELPEVETLKDEPAVTASAAPKRATPPGSLRTSCPTCAYKNPRDVNACMKCGTPLADVEEPVAKAPAATKITEPTLGPGPITVPKLETAGPPPIVATPETKMATPPGMIEVPVTKILLLTALAAALAGGSFAGYRYYQKRHHPKAAAAVKPVSPSIPTSTRAPRKTASRTTSRTKGAGLASPKAIEKTALPGLHNESASHSAPPKETTQAASSEAPANYRIIDDAQPLRHRQSSPLDSPYAKKARANKALWTEQEQRAVQQVQRFRIYGGQRTIARNTEILMQILRDKEYDTAFESGRRLQLYNDLDWGASQKDGPLYEVRLTFSGGRENDGSPKKPLRFAFYTDIERGTVEPGGDEQTRGNTLHAFFDESRIPPEERRGIAKDTEELVLAAQPDASPLALDTVVRHFVAVYSPGALQRVANAFGLTLVQKRMARDPQVGGDVAKTPARTAYVASKEAPAIKGSAALGMPGVGGPPASPSAIVKSQSVKLPPSVSGSIGYEMSRGAGKDRTLTANAPSKATPGKLWETLTGYDRLKQFVPDLIVSEREGQDGSAIIVHTVFLTRFMFFVFKTNLHLRIIEHPMERTIEFERIAGEFESFRGSAQIMSDPTTQSSSLVFRATVVPTGRMPDWVLRGMAQRFLLPVLEAVRSHAETN